MENEILAASHFALLSPCTIFARHSFPQIYMTETTHPGNSSISGIVTEGGLTGLSSRFTDIELIPTKGFNFLARAKRYGRWWMLKGLKEEYRGQLVYRALLEKEFSILVGMQHPGIVSSSGMETVEGLGPCIVMEWIDGTTLKEWLTAKHSIAEKRAVALQIMQALAYVHGKQTAHRDLKPSNVLITRNGERVKLIDFGLSDTDQYAMLKQPAGSQGYISPEQQEVAQADVRNDIYSLGCLLSDLHLGIMYAGVVRKCRADVERRYQSVEEVERAFLRYGRIKVIAFATTALVAIMTITSITITQRETLSKKNEIAPSKVDSLERQMQLLSYTTKNADGRQKKAESAADESRESGNATENSDAAQIQITQLQNQLNEEKERKRQIDEVIQRGKQGMKRIFDRYHFDRITDYKELEKADENCTAQMYTYYQQYVKTFPAEWNDSERANAEHSLAKYYEELFKPILNRLLKHQRQAFDSRQ